APPWVGRGRCRSGPGDGVGGGLVDRLDSGQTPLPAAALDGVAQGHLDRLATVLVSFGDVEDRIAAAVDPPGDLGVDTGDVRGGLLEHVTAGKSRRVPVLRGRRLLGQTAA